MNEAPSHVMLLALGEDLGYPNVTLGTLAITGEIAWRAALPRTAPIERRAWLEALGGPLLTATPSSRERMEAWHARSWSAPTTPELVHERLLFYGDESMFEPVCAAFQFMPEVVRDFTLLECAVLAVGSDSYGWTGSSSFADRDGLGRPRVIVLSGADRHASRLIHAVLHEVAHGWSCPTPHVLVTAQGETGLRAYAEAQGLTEKVDNKAAFDERIACALASLWLAQGTR